MHELIEKIARYLMLAFIGGCLAYVSVNTTGTLQEACGAGLVFYAVLIVIGSLRPG